jgi:two-component system cell cycle sensor histidine kinase/response regulator CckA
MTSGTKPEPGHDFFAPDSAYRTLFAQSLDAMILGTPDGQILDANEEACRMFLCTVDELRAAGRSGISDPADTSFAGMQAKLAVDNVFRGDVSFLRMDGTPFHAEISIRRFGSAEGTPLTALVLRDLTESDESRREEKQVREKLRQSEERFRLAARASNDGFYDLDVENGVVWRHGALLEGLESVDFHAYLGRVHPDDRDQIEKDFNGALEAGRDQWTSNYRLGRPDGGWAYVLDRSFFIRDASGKATRVVGSVVDLTERRMAEEALVHSEARLRNLVESAMDAVIAIDAGGRIVEWNTQAERTFGWSASEAKGKTLSSLIVPPSLRQAHESGLGNYMDGGSPSIVNRRVELTALHSDGHEFPVELSVTRVQPHTGEAVFSAFLRDITEVKAAREALHESEERYRTAFMTANDIIFELDRNGIIQRLNPVFQVITGWRGSEWIGKSLEGLIAPQDIGLARESFQRLSEDGGPVSLECRILTPSGGSIIIQASSTAEISSDGMGRVFGIARDVTEQRRGEKERDRLARDLRLLLESTTEGIFSIDGQGLCTIVNRAALQMLGYPRKEMLGRNFHELVHYRRTDGSHFPVQECPIYTSMRGVTTRVGRETFWRSDGTSFPIEYSASPIIDEGQFKGAVVTFSDVAERALLENQLQQANRLSGLGRLAATIAHEFNNVLMGVQPFAQLIGRLAEPDGQIASSALQISHSVQRGKKITQEIFRFTQPSLPTLRAVEAVAFLRAFQNDVAPVVEPLNLALKIDSGALFMRADPEQIHQVLTNLVINARDAMSGSGTITLRALPCVSGAVFPFGTLASPDRYLHIEVSDTGAGIPHDLLDQIFEPLFTTKHQGGTGLGLAVAHQIIMQHDGEIFVESELGRGTTFHLFLPAALPELATAEQEQLQKHRGRRVLIVEDDDAVASGLVTLLEMEGLITQRAETGQSAVDEVRNRVPDLVVLDLGLPDLDGLEVFRRIRDISPQVPVIFSTGHGDQERLRPYLDGGTAGLLLKPYEIRDLLVVISRLLGKRPDNSST